MKRFSQLTFIAGCTTLLAFVAHGQKNEDATPAAEKIPLVTSEIERNSKDVSSEFSIKVTIVNTTEAPISLVRLKPVVPAASNRKSTAKVVEWPVIVLNGQRLSPSQKAVKRISVPPASIVGTLLFVSSNWDTGATLFYNLEDVTQPTREIETTNTVDWQGSIWGKLFGGLIGCAALALFLSSREIAQQPTQSRKRFLFATTFFSTLAVGFATVLAATLLIAFLTPGSLPISFSVEDWRGGALLGLFSVPIGGWLLDKLSSKKLAENDKKAKQ